LITISLKLTQSARYVPIDDGIGFQFPRLFDQSLLLLRYAHFTISFAHFLKKNHLACGCINPPHGLSDFHINSSFLNISISVTILLTNKSSFCQSFSLLKSTVLRFSITISITAITTMSSTSVNALRKGINFIKNL